MKREDVSEPREVNGGRNTLTTWDGRLMLQRIGPLVTGISVMQTRHHTCASPCLLCFGEKV